MQENFIDEIETRGKKDINDKQEKINELIKETDEYVNTNEELESEISELIKKQDEYTGASDKLLKLNTIKGKLTQKVSTLTKRA